MLEKAFANALPQTTGAKRRMSEADDGGSALGKKGLARFNASDTSMDLALALSRKLDQISGDDEHCLPSVALACGDPSCSIGKKVRRKLWTGRFCKSSEPFGFAPSMVQEKWEVLPEGCSSRRGSFTGKRMQLHTHIPCSLHSLTACEHVATDARRISRLSVRSNSSRFSVRSSGSRLSMRSNSRLSVRSGNRPAVAPCESDDLDSISSDATLIETLRRPASVPNSVPAQRSMQLKGVAANYVTTPRAASCASRFWKPTPSLCIGLPKTGVIPSFRIKRKYQ